MGLTSNLRQIRTAIFRRADWAPTSSPEAIVRVNDSIQRAYEELVLDAPFLFFESQVHLTTISDETPLTEKQDTLSTTGDQWVLQRFVLPADSTWPLDGAWDGRMLLVRIPDGDWERYRIRTIWADQTSVNVSLFRPWSGALPQNNIEWRIYDDFWTYPDDMIELKSARLFKGSENWPLRVVGQDDAENYALIQTPDLQTKGVPRAMFRRGSWSIPGPTTAVAGGNPGPITWDAGTVNHQPAGTFSYRITYCWGYRNIDWQTPQGGQESRAREPKWESPPSPDSEIITVTHAGNAIELTLPDIDYMQGFGNAADLRYQKSGWRIRIYRRRHTINALGASEPNIENSDHHYLLKEVNAGTVTFTDNGSDIPEYHRPLREVHAYQTFDLYPRPDKDYQIDIRCLKSPRMLLDNTDVPAMLPGATNILISRALVFLWEIMGQLERQQTAFAEYQLQLKRFRARFGDMRPPAIPISKKPMRASAYNTRYPHSRRWYSTDT